MNKKVLGAGLIAVVAGLGFGAGLLVDNPQDVEIVKEVIVEVPFEVVKEVEVEKEVVITEIVEDEAMLELVCDKLMFDDISECKEEVSAEDAALKQALSLIEDTDELFDFLEDEGFINDEDEARVVKVYDDFEDIVVVKSNFDNEIYKFEVKVRVEDEDEDIKKKVWLAITVDEGEAELKNVWDY